MATPWRRAATPARPHPRYRGLRNALTFEQGIALPVAVMMLFIVILVAAAVATQAITASSQSRRDRSVKRAIAAADAGVQVATYRTNKVSSGMNECVVAGVGGLVLEPVQADGWCRTQTEDLGDNASYTYRVRAARQVTVNGQRLLQRKVVSTGVTNGVKRRIATVMGSSTGLSLFGGYGVISLDDLSLPNSTQVQGNAASNGNISVMNSAEICGNATVGPGKQFTTSNSGHLCAGFLSWAAEEPFVLNPVDQGDAATANNNSFIGTVDTWTNPSKITWNATQRVLRLQNSATVTLTGDVYSFCFLEIDNNSQLIIAPRASGRPPLKIFIDSPEHCGGRPSSGSVVLRNGGAITNLNPDPTTVQLFALGTSTATTSVNFDNNFDTEVNLLIYAPQSRVSLTNHTHIRGAVAAQSVVMDNNTTIIWDRRSETVTVDDLLPRYTRQNYSECTVESAGAAPDSGC